MKKLLTILVLAACVVSSCSERDLYVAPDDPTDYTPNVPLENFKLTKDFTVPVEEGKVTVVTYNGEVIYEGNVPVTIEVPAVDMASTRSEGLEWHQYRPVEEYPWGYTHYRKAVLLFEDVENGDNDYNDFVCYINDQISVGKNAADYSGKTNKFTWEILKLTPLAMGNDLPIQFGFDVVNINTGEGIADCLIYRDVRAEAFNGKEGFINTNPKLDKVIYPDMSKWILYPSHISPISENIVYAYNYYIIVNGVKYYTANSKNALPTSDNVPFGLYIPSTETFNYPIEKTSIFKAYPNFKKWLEGSDVSPFSNPNTDLIYHYNEK